MLAGLLPLQAYAGDCREGNTIPDIRLQVVAKGLDKPVAISHAGDGSGRLFVLEQAGQIRVIKNDALLTEPLLDVRSEITAGGEKGLLGIAFHPAFQKTDLLYLNYTANRPRLQTFISEFHLDKTGKVDTKSERILLSIDQPWGNHNGGQLAFGPDGYLYIGVGDGGSGNDPNNNGQNLATLLGSILRIDVDQRSEGRAYAIPADNPFIATPEARPEIWAYGLRNPWRFSFDRDTGTLYAADVGQDEVEEIDIIEKGKNYGWRVMEGPQCTPGVNRDCNNQGYTLPIYSYRHDTGRSITGGYVYRGKAIPKLCGTYLYGDFVNQAIWGLRYREGMVVRHKTLYDPKFIWNLAIDYFRDDGLLISTFGEDEAGEVYVAAYQSGTIYRIVTK
jgi:glucose/arabinose dehydrogenase